MVTKKRMYAWKHLDTGNMSINMEDVNYTEGGRSGKLWDISLNEPITFKILNASYVTFNCL